MDIHLSGVVEDSIVDGVGFRYTLFTQGCNHFCKGCHNEHTHSRDKIHGYMRDVCDVFDDIKNYSGFSMLSGVTFSGGEPFLQASKLHFIAVECKTLGLDVWCYTGYKIEELVELAKVDTSVYALLCVVDVLVDGAYIESERDELLYFRGSTNQRVIDMHEYRENNKIVTLY